MKTLHQGHVARRIARLFQLPLLGILILPLSAQQFELIGGTVGNTQINTKARVTLNVPTGDPCNPRLPNGAITDRQWNGNNFVPSAFLQNIPNLADPNKPWDLFYHFNLTSLVDGRYRVGDGGTPTCDCFLLESKHHEARAQSMMFLAANGDQSGELLIKWRNLSQVATHNTDQSGAADGSSDSNLSISFQITGLPLNTPVDVHYKYNTTSLGWTRHEGGAEDPITIKLRNLSLAGSSLIPPGTNPDGHALYNVPGQMSLLAGQPYTLDFSAKTSAEITKPSKRLNGFCLAHFIDSAFAQVMGKIILSFSPVVQPLPGSPAHTQACQYDLVYSVDIGSATETSTPPGGGPLDPGDLYPRNYVTGGANPSFFRDDAGYFSGVDPWPIVLAPPTYAPVNQGVPIDLARDVFFNIDAAALLPFDLTLFNYGYGQPALTRADIQLATGAADCIVPPRYVLISERDSANSAYSSSFPKGAPFNSIAPGGPYGTTSERDEVVQYEFPVYGGNVVTGPDPLFDEPDFDPVLLPAPAAGQIDLNDDVNALAVAQLDPALSNCADFTYFSVAAQARNGLDPGIIYVAPAGGGNPVAAVTPDHLGLPWKVDVDTAEFTWWVDPASGQASLALLFSVAEDLQETPEDESGGRDPSRVYVSLLNGTHMPTALAGIHDVDALAVIPCRASQPLRVLTSLLPTGEVCSRYGATLASTGGYGMVVTWSVTVGNLPPGLSLNPHTGEISGVPTLDGNFPFEVTAVDPTGQANQQNLNLIINSQPGPPAVTSGALPSGSAGLPYHEVVPSSGGCQPVYLTIDGGELPPGLMLDVVSGVISGTPRSPGLYPFLIRATDATGAVATAPLSIEIIGSVPPPLKLDQRIFGPFNPGDAFSIPLIASGGTPPYQFFLSNPPPGFTLSGDTITGTASTPPLIAGLDVDVQDSQFNIVNEVVYYLVLSPLPGDPQIAPLPSQDWVAGQAVDLVPTVVGGTPPLSFAWVDSSPPTGIGFSPSNGRVHGIPTATGEGVIPLLVTDANGRQDAIAVPYVIHAGFPGGYAAWKTFHGVAADTDDDEPDTFPAMGEYFMGLDPTVRDNPSTYQIRQLPNGLMQVDFPTAGVPDVHAELQRLNPATLQWFPYFSNPFPPYDPNTILRLKFESP